jgi:hypothetical protein
LREGVEMPVCKKCANQYDRHGNGHKDNCPIKQALLEMSRKVEERHKEKGLRVIIVILYLDVYSFVNDSERFWQRQIWSGMMPEKEDACKYDPLLLQKEGGLECESHVLFRLNEYVEQNRMVIYHPVAIHHSSWFLKALPEFGFKLDQIGNQEPISVRVTHYITGASNEQKEKA